MLAAIVGVTGIALVFSGELEHVQNAWLGAGLAVLAFGIYIRILPAVGSVAGAYIVVLSPVIAIGVSALLEGLAVGPATFAGIALLLVGQSLLVRERPG